MRLNFSAIVEATELFAADPDVRPDRPYAVDFPAQNARFVRLVIHETTGGEGLGKMDSGEQGRIRLGPDIFKRERTPQLGEPHHHAAVPVLSAATEFLQS